MLVIDDILDEGHTLVAIRKALLEFAPRTLKVAVLAEKRHDRRAAGADAEFIGLAVEDRYVFGCGMGWVQSGRQPRMRGRGPARPSGPHAGARRDLRRRRGRAQSPRRANTTGTRARQRAG